MLARQLLLRSGGTVMSTGLRRVNYNAAPTMMMGNRAMFSTGSSNNNNSEQQQTLPPGPSTDRVKILEEEVARMKQELLYCLADQENTRKIARKDVQDAKMYGSNNFAKSMLDVADNLQKAAETMDKFATAGQQSPQVTSFVQGIKAVEHELLKALKSNGVEPFGAQLDKFDPNRHEALANIPVATQPANTIYQVLRRGWSLNGRVLRPCQVTKTVAAPEVDKSFLERKVDDKFDESDDLEAQKQKIKNANVGPSGQKSE